MFDQSQAAPDVDVSALAETDGNWIVRGINNNNQIEIELSSIYNVEIDVDNSSRLTA